MAEAAAAEEVPNATLQILDLGSNVVGRDGAEALKNVLVRQAAPLHTLGVADTALGEEGGIAIAEALEGNGRLQRVDLRRNRLGLAGLMALQLSNGTFHRFKSNYTILATGGYGRVFKTTTCAYTVTGDGNAMASRAGIPLKDMEFMQFHPTGLYLSLIHI